MANTTNGNGTLGLILKVALPVATGIVVPLLLAIVPWMIRVQANLAQLGEQIAQVAKQHDDHKAEHVRLWVKIDRLEDETRRLAVDLAAERRPD